MAGNGCSAGASADENHTGLGSADGGFRKKAFAGGGRGRGADQAAEFAAR
ncbi:MAG: hypothetical protein IIC56_07555 [Proteobacteria bacterium]|nr:hypothetical protein [Pseudomonadota bacterium]